MSQDRSAKEATMSSLVPRIREVLVRRHFDLTGSLKTCFECFEKWAQTYQSVPDKATLREKMVEFGVLQNPKTADLLISELGMNFQTNRLSLPELPPPLPNDDLEFDYRALDEIKGVVVKNPARKGSD